MIESRATTTTSSTTTATSTTAVVAAWMYSGIWSVLVHYFRVPGSPPTLPTRPGETLESFKPARGFLGYMKFWFWIICLAIDLGILIGWIVLLILIPLLGVILAPIALAVAIVPDIIAYIAIHLRYDTTWYLMTGRSLRIRRGIWTIHETTITFENVQNVNIRQGPLQRIFGISDLIVETAGAGGGSGGGGHGSGGGSSIANQGVIEGIGDAYRLRDMIMARLRASQSAGLGDEAGGGGGAGGGRAAAAAQARSSSPQHAWSDRHVSVLREIRQEIAALSG